MERDSKKDQTIEFIVEETSEGYESLYWALRLPIWRNYLSDIVTLLVALVYANDLESISQLTSYMINSIQKERSIIRYAIEFINVIYWVLPGSLKEQLRSYIHGKYRELVRQDPDLLDPENFKEVAFYNANVFADFFLTKEDVSYIAEHRFLEPKHIFWVLDRAKDVDHQDINKLLRVLYRPISSIDRIEIYRPKNKEVFSLVLMLLRKTTDIEKTLLTLESFVEKLFKIYMTLIETEVMEDHDLVMFLATLGYLIKSLRPQAQNQYWNYRTELEFEVSMLINTLLRLLNKERFYEILDNFLSLGYLEFFTVGSDPVGAADEWIVKSVISELISIAEERNIKLEYEFLRQIIVLVVLKLLILFDIVYTKRDNFVPDEFISIGSSLEDLALLATVIMRNVEG